MQECHGKRGENFCLFMQFFGGFLKDWVGPAILYSSGHTSTCPILLIGHFEWIAYPAYFAFARIFKSIGSNLSRFVGFDITVNSGLIFPSIFKFLWKNQFILTFKTP